MSEGTIHDTMEHLGNIVMAAVMTAMVIAAFEMFGCKGGTAVLIGCVIGLCVSLPDFTNDEWEA